MLQTGDKDVEVSDIWKSRRNKPNVKSESPHNAFRRWRKSASSKLSESRSGTNDSKTPVNSREKDPEEDMSLLKFLAIVSTAFFIRIVNDIQWAFKNGILESLSAGLLEPKNPNNDRQILITITGKLRSPNINGVHELVKTLL